MFEIPAISLAMALFLLGLGTTALLLQPVLFNWSASAAGEKAPGWLKGAFALMVSSAVSIVGGVVYGFTLGLVLSRLGTVPAAVGGLAVSLLCSSVVFSAFLRVSVARAARVVLLYWVGSWTMLAALGLLVRLIVF